MMYEYLSIIYQHISVQYYCITHSYINVLGTGVSMYVCIVKRICISVALKKLSVALIFANIA
jgi:hypothetical protein